MSTTDRGPATTYEITWMSGRIERIEAHQVSWPDNASALFGSGPKRDPRIQFHADINGRWTLQLSAVEADIRTIRNLATESGPVLPDARQQG